MAGSGGSLLSRAAKAVLLLLVLAPPLAAAAPAEVELTTPAPIRWRGALAIDAPGGHARIEASDAEGTYRIEGLHGRLEIWTLRVLHVGTDVVVVEQEVRQDEPERLALGNATLSLRLEGEALAAVVVASRGTLGIEGTGEGEGRPVRVPARVEHREGLVLDYADYVSWRWDAGWAFLGESVQVPVAPFPVWDEPLLRMAGDAVAIQLHGGNVTLTDEAGETRTWRLGAWTEGDGAGEVRHETWRRLIFRGRVGEGLLPAEGEWGVAAPDVSWRLEGEILWKEATGRARTAEGARAFTDATVRGAGALVLAAPPLALPPAEAMRYAAEGDWRTLSIDGQPTLAPHAGLPAYVPLAGLTFVALLAAAATEGGLLRLARAFAPLYTRLTPGEMLAHPQRRRLFETAREEPGLHLRDLHRRVGGAWGQFTFHVGMLVEAGYLATRREGRYRVVYPAAGPAPEAPRVRHALARTLLDQLPQDGTALGAGALRARLGVSRQRMDHHLRALETAGLVTVAHAPPGGERAVARARAGTRLRAGSFFLAPRQQASMPDEIPSRARRTAERPERVPDPGHDKPVQVPQAEWEQHNRRRDTAEGLARDEEPVE